MTTTSRLFCLLFLLLPTFAHAQDPWAALAEVRATLLEAGPTAADFVQDYRPAGFEAADRETGRLALSLPACLRWDYLTPYAKGFLLCGEVVHAWVEEDKAGQRYKVDPQNEPGLDLLLLATDDLRLRYRADAKEIPDGLAEVVLRPLDESARIQVAKLTLELETKRLVALEYQDVDGGTTRFELSAYRPLEAGVSFAPPPEVAWTDELKGETTP